jgi:predicted ABC-type transport system involved in lysophospholipase L1 biosynthesis ATPase subunit
MIDLASVSKTVTSGSEKLTILHAVNLSIPRGKFVAIVGPSGNLDSKNVGGVFDLLVKLNRDRSTTLLLVTHDHALASQADRMINLSEGRIVEDREMGSGELGMGNGESGVVEVASLSPTPHSPLPTPHPSEEAT